MEIVKKEQMETGDLTELKRMENKISALVLQFASRTIHDFVICAYIRYGYLQVTTSTLMPLLESYFRTCTESLRDRGYINEMFSEMCLLSNAQSILDTVVMMTISILNEIDFKNLVQPKFMPTIVAVDRRVDHIISQKIRDVM